MKSLQPMQRRRRDVDATMGVPDATVPQARTTCRWRRLALGLTLALAMTSTARAERIGTLAVDGQEIAAIAHPGPPKPKADAAAQQSWLADRLAVLERLLKRSGLDVEALIERAGPGELSTGQGGPLVPALGDEPPAEASLDSNDVDRLERVHRLLEAVPLAAPMAAYRLTSGFGYRRDPFTRRGAVHEGQDFGGPRHAPVLATAPGKIVKASRAGAYGIMVEIDHGMGIHTRYAHLRKALVRPGQKVEVSDRIGIMGSTGRSTGAHLHYEIRVDGRPLNPRNFLAAGSQLQQIAAGDG